MTSSEMIIIRGYPGSGKTTTGKMLSKKKGNTFIDHNAILNFLANIVGNDEGIYGEIHALELAMTRKLLEENKNVIIARGFSSPESIVPYQELAKKSGANVFVFRLVVSEENLKLRVIAEDRKKDFNPTTNENALLGWIAANPLQDMHGEHKIDANKSVDEVVSQIISIISP